MVLQNIGILIFDDVEVLDFTGPFEVFSRTRLSPGIESRRTEDSAPFRVFTVAPTSAVITATGGLRVVPSYALLDAPRIDVLVVPGGFGTRSLLENDELLAWIAARGASASTVASVCTGALLLAKIGLLRGQRATTHRGALDLLSSIDPTITVEREARVVSDVVTSSAGVAAGIDMAFSLVARFCGAEVACDTARYIEYPWEPEGL